MRMASQSFSSGEQVRQDTSQDSRDVKIAPRNRAFQYARLQATSAKGTSERRQWRHGFGLMGRLEMGNIR